MTEIYFKEGDLVTCILSGKGTVTKANCEGDYPIQVKFEKSSITYTFDGRQFVGLKRMLHQVHIDLPEPELVPIVEYTKGEIVWYKDGTNWLVGFYEREGWVKTQVGDMIVVMEIRKFDNPPTFKVCQ